MDGVNQKWRIYKTHWRPMPWVFDAGQHAYWVCNTFAEAVQAMDRYRARYWADA